MLGRMKRTRPAIWGGAVLLVAIAALAACTAKQQNGQDCLKGFDCESNTCVQRVCVDPNASRTPTTVDSGTATDTGPVDTGTAMDGAMDGASDATDSGALDSGSAASDTGAD